MASEEYPSAKEPPWGPPILPPMPRISVSTNSRARLSHRRPILSPPTPTPLPPAVVVPSPPPALISSLSPDGKCSESPILEASPPPLVVVPSPLQSLISSESPNGKYSESSILEAFSPPAPPPQSWASASSRLEAGLEALWPAPSSSADVLDCCPVSNTAPADKATRDAVAKPLVDNICSLSNDDSSGNRSSLCSASEFVPPTHSDHSIVLANGSDSPVSCPIAHISSPPAALKQNSSSIKDGDQGGVQENVAGFGRGLRDGVNEAKDPDCGKPISTDGCIPSDLQIGLAETTSSASCLRALEEVDDECRGAGIRVIQEKCFDVDGEAENPHLVKNDELVLDEGELQEEQQPQGDGRNEAKDPEPCQDVCTSGYMEFTVAESTSSLRSLNALEKVDELKGGDNKVNQGNSTAIGHEDEISDVVKSEELLPEEGELEEGQLPGEWSGAEESHEDSEPAQIMEDSEAVPSSVGRGGVPGFPKTVNLADQIYYPFQVEEVYSEHGSRGNSKAKGKKKKKHKKGEGSKKRSREKSKEKYNEVLKKRRVEGKGDGVSNRGLRNNNKDCSGRGLQNKNNNNNNGPSKLKKLPDNVSPTKAKVPTVDEGPEDGEILLEPTKTNNGILSSIVEDEVGLWTTDNVDDQFVTEMEEDGAVKKKRGPETAERKLKRKIAKRKKRAQKERELGIRRPPRTVQSKPVKVLCTHYMKGRCAKGDQCTFSHDAVPLTKLEPCKFLMSHSCLKGDDCPYSHDLRAFPCKFFHTRGLCYDGENCQFSHGAISEEALEKLKQRVEKEKKERISSSTSSYADIPTPSFSTPLPPELDPDPLGWGTPSSYPSSHEEQMQYTSHLKSLDQSNLFEPDFNFDNNTNVPPAAGMMSGQSVGAPSVIIDRADTNSTDVVSPMQIEEEAKEYNYLESDNTRAALESGQSMDVTKFKREAESSIPTRSASTEGPDSSTVPGFFKTAGCSSPPNERSNAREVLEVPRMEEKMDKPQSSLGDLLPRSNESSIQGLLSVASSVVSPLPARVPLVRGRQLGSLVVEHTKTPQSLLQTVSKRQHTVESLLDEALRQQ